MKKILAALLSIWFLGNVVNAGEVTIIVFKPTDAINVTNINANYTNLASAINAIYPSSSKPLSKDIQLYTNDLIQIDNLVGYGSGVVTGFANMYIDNLSVTNIVVGTGTVSQTEVDQWGSNYAWYVIHAPSDTVFTNTGVWATSVNENGTNILVSVGVLETNAALKSEANTFIEEQTFTFNPTNHQYVRGAGSNIVNGAYAYTTTLYGKPQYFSSDGSSARIEWSTDYGGYWAILPYIGIDILYKSTDDVTTPDLCTTWETNATTVGTYPLPTVVARSSSISPNGVVIDDMNVYDDVTILNTNAQLKSDADVDMIGDLTVGSNLTVNGTIDGGSITENATNILAVANSNRTDFVAADTTVSNAVVAGYLADGVAVSNAFVAADTTLSNALEASKYNVAGDTLTGTMDAGGQNITNVYDIIVTNNIMVSGNIIFPFGKGIIWMSTNDLSNPSAATNFVRIYGHSPTGVVFNYEYNGISSNINDNMIRD